MLNNLCPLFNKIIAEIKSRLIYFMTIIANGFSSCWKFYWLKDDNSNGDWSAPFKNLKNNKCTATLIFWTIVSPLFGVHWNAFL